MNRTGLYNLLSIVIPLTCLLGVVVILVMLRSRAVAAESQGQQTTQQLSTIQTRIKELESVQRQPLEATVEATPMEETGFLNLVRGYAGAGVTIDKFSVATPVAPTVGGSTDATAAPVRPAGVSSVSGSIDVSGSYNSVRQFLYNLHRSSRLFTLRDVKWKRGDKPGITSASFTLTRYVHSPSKTLQTGQPATSAVAAPAGTP